MAISSAATWLIQSFSAAVGEFTGSVGQAEEKGGFIRVTTRTWVQYANPSQWNNTACFPQHARYA
jgi:hypothetical protein